MKRAALVLIGALLFSTAAPATAHEGGTKFSAMALRETVDGNGNFAVTAKVWNFTAVPRKIKIVVEVVVNQIVEVPETSCIGDYCSTYSDWQTIERYTTKSTVLRVPPFGTNRKRMYGSFIATGWSFGADDSIYADILHAHRG